jgi:hypothetical protein
MLSYTKFDFCKKSYAIDFGIEGVVFTNAMVPQRPTV